MPADSLLVLQAEVTKTATFNSTGVNLRAGTPRRGLYARVICKDATNASGSNTVAFTIQHSDDNSTYYELASGKENDIALSTTAQAKVFFISIETDKDYVRLVQTTSGAGSTPTVTYYSDIVLSRP